MQEIGGLLRDAREAQGMTLEDVERVTKIRRRYLGAIENGDFSQVPGEVQLRGFMRNYAAAVGLDPGAIIGRYLESRGAAAVGEDTLAGAKTEILVVEERRPRRLLFIALLALLIVTAAALCYFFVYAGRRGDLPSGDSYSSSQPVEAQLLEDTESQTVEPLPGIEELSSGASPQLLSELPSTDTPASPQPLDAVGDADPSMAETVAAPVDNYEVRVVFSGMCWYRVEGEGIRSDEGFGRDGDERVWTVPPDASLRLGNAGHVSVFVNGELVTNDARQGEVRVLRLPTGGESSRPSLVRP